MGCCRSPVSLRRSTWIGSPAHSPWSSRGGLVWSDPRVGPGPSQDVQASLVSLSAVVIAQVKSMTMSLTSASILVRSTGRSAPAQGYRVPWMLAMRVRSCSPNTSRTMPRIVCSAPSVAAVGLLHRTSSQEGGIVKVSLRAGAWKSHSNWALPFHVLCQVRGTRVRVQAGRGHGRVHRPKLGV